MYGNSNLLGAMGLVSIAIIISIIVAAIGIIALNTKLKGLSDVLIRELKVNRILKTIDKFQITDYIEFNKKNVEIFLEHLKNKTDYSHCLFPGTTISKSLSERDISDYNIVHIGPDTCSVKMTCLDKDLRPVYLYRLTLVDKYIYSVRYASMEPDFKKYNNGKESRTT